MILGIVIVLVGFSIRFLACMQLGKNFSFTLKTPTLITKTGLYRYIRHPSYLGSIVMFAGICIISQTAAIMYLVFVFYLARVHEEEKYLVLLKGYLEYRKKTGMFLPKIRKVS